LYESRKQQGTRTDLTSGQNVQKLTTAEQIGKEYGVDEKTIRRDADFSEAVDKVMGLRCLRGASNEAPKTEAAGFRFRKRPGCTNVPAEAGVFSRNEVFKSEHLELSRVANATPETTRWCKCTM